MKKSMLAAILFLSVATACNNDKDNNTPTENSPTENKSSGDEGGGTSSFTIDGKKFTGKVSVQDFSTGEFSVLCQQDEPFALFQVVFKDKASTRATAPFKPAGSQMNIESGEAYVTFNEKEMYSTQSDSKGTIEVSGSTLTIKDLQLFTVTNDKSVVLSGSFTW